MRATTRTSVTTDASDWTMKSAFAQALMGMVSVGLKAVALVNEVYR